MDSSAGVGMMKLRHYRLRLEGQAEIISQLVSVPAVSQRKRGLFSVQCERLKCPASHVPARAF